MKTDTGNHPHKSSKPAPVRKDDLQAALPTIPQLSTQTEPAQLLPSTFLKIDHATLFDNIAVISGWHSASATLQLDGLLAMHVIQRPDADAAVRHVTRGFIAVFAMPVAKPAIEAGLVAGEKQVRFHVKFASIADELIKSMQYYALFSRELLAYFTKSRLFSEHLAKNCIALSHSQRANDKNGHIDIAKIFPGFGYVAYGWSVSKKNTQFWLVSDDRHWTPLSQSVQFNRPDVAASFEETFGTYAAEAGFFCVVRQPAIREESTIRLVAATENGLSTVHELTASRGPQSPAAYAKWAFTLSTPPSKFFERLNSSEGELIEYLIMQNRAAYPRDIEILSTGGLSPQPEISVIVPLYGRSDFLEYQLTYFSRDEDFVSGKAELIYVVDDPSLMEHLRLTFHQLFKLYKIPFRIVWGKINRGYSGANNLGLKIARGCAVILLNSDVFPKHEGWARRMSEALLSDETIGAVGARLDYADGSLQHQGMVFEHAIEWDVWLNKHPLQGFDVPAGEAILEVEATTGACLAARRSDLEAIGGLDEGFLIGDFEDSALCLQLRELRSRIIVLTGIRLVHLERQSFSTLGGSDFRTNVVKFNAWRHTRLWGNKIAALKEKFAK